MGKERKRFISVRLDAELLGRIDALAAREGLTRTAVIEGMCRRELNGVRIRGSVSEVLRAVGGLLNPVYPQDVEVDTLISGLPDMMAR